MEFFFSYKNIIFILNANIFYVKWVHVHQNDITRSLQTILLRYKAAHVKYDVKNIHVYSTEYNCHIIAKIKRAFMKNMQAFYHYFSTSAQITLLCVQAVE